jgi:hypothetical protein
MERLATIYINGAEESGEEESSGVRKSHVLDWAQQAYSHYYNGTVARGAVFGQLCGFGTISDSHYKKQSTACMILRINYYWDGFSK